MKKLITISLMLFTMISIAMAQPAMMTKGSSEMSTQVDTDTVCQDENDRLSVTITTTNGQIFHHPQHPEIGSICPFGAMFRTTESYAWYQWEIVFQDTIIKTTDRVYVMVTMPGYIKVTVGDNYGHTGSDYIWFNVYYVPPMENLIMEIDDDFHANFSGIATENHRELIIACQNNPNEWINIHSISLSPGEWTYKDSTITYCNDTIWVCITELLGFNDCQPIIESVEIIPGLLLNSKKLYYNTWYLDIKTIIQSYIQYYINHDFVYFVYTIDQYGQRHHFHDENGNPVILTIEQTEWRIPGPHADPYYQCGVARRLDDGSYKLLSLSNKIENPLLDVTSTNEIDDKRTFCYPNPNNGNFTINGSGTLSITNILGQQVLSKQIHGETQLNLPKGMYIIKITSKNYSDIQKIVVQ